MTLHLRRACPAAFTTPGPAAVRCAVRPHTAPALVVVSLVASPRVRAGLAWRRVGTALRGRYPARCVPSGPSGRARAAAPPGSSGARRTRPRLRRSGCSPWPVQGRHPPGWGGVRAWRRRRLRDNMCSLARGRPGGLGALPCCGVRGPLRWRRVVNAPRGWAVPSAKPLTPLAQACRACHLRGPQGGCPPPGSPVGDGRGTLFPCAGYPGAPGDTPRPGFSGPLPEQAALAAAATCPGPATTRGRRRAGGA